MVDNIREWISDNLRYILLGLAVILLIIIAFFAVRLVTHLGSSGETEAPAQTTEAQTAQSTSSTEAAEEALVKDQADVLAKAKEYWTAIQDQDFDTLAKICAKTFDESEQETIKKSDAAVESYDNISTYSKTGLTEGSYVVYVYMDLKLTGIETEAPTLREMYMETDANGDLIVIQKDDYTSEISAYTKEREADSDVQALIQDVNNTLSERCEQDEDLNQYVESSQTETEASTETGTETGSTDSTGSTDTSESTDTSGASLGTMTVNSSEGVNVRSSASTDGTLLASLSQGAQVEVVENLDSGWSKITYYDTNGSAVEGYVMTQYLSSSN